MKAVGWQIGIGLLASLLLCLGIVGLFKPRPPDTALRLPGQPPSLLEIGQGQRTAQTNAFRNLLFAQKGRTSLHTAETLFAEIEKAKDSPSTLILMEHELGAGGGDNPDPVLSFLRVVIEKHLRFQDPVRAMREWFPVHRYKYSGLYKDWARRDPDAALVSAFNHPDGDRNLLIQSAIEGTLETAPEIALKHWQKFVNPDLRFDLSTSVAENLARRNPMRFQEWLAIFPFHHHEIIRSSFWAWGEIAPEVALAEAAKLPDESSLQATQAALMGWSCSDPKAADTWAKAAGFFPPEREEEEPLGKNPRSPESQELTDSTGRFFAEPLDGSWIDLTNEALLWLARLPAEILESEIRQRLEEEGSKNKAERTFTYLLMGHLSDIDSMTARSLVDRQKAGGSLARRVVAASARRDPNSVQASTSTDPDPSDALRTSYRVIGFFHPEYDPEWATATGVPLPWFSRLWVDRGESATAILPAILGKSTDNEIPEGHSDEIADFFEQQALKGTSIDSLEALFNQLPESGDFRKAA
ncbi:MAG: hypothetical protein AAF514_20040, partial [Verrucomicrobiota bacterium]